MAAPIEDYGLIGDLQTVALVSRQGSIDWLCVPRFDSGAIFASLLGADDNGHWTIQPDGDFRSPRRSYRGDTLVLETEFETPSGTARLVDFMPPRGEAPDVVRIVEGVQGFVDMRMELVAPLRLRVGRPLGAEPRRQPHRHRRARRRLPADAGRARGPQPAYVRGVPGARGRANPVRPDVVPVAPRPAPAGACRRRGGAEGHHRVLGGLGEQLHAGGALARRGRAVAPHAESAHVCTDRRHRGGRDDLAAGGDRRRHGTGTTATAGCGTRR